ncbi:putative secreted effector protein [Blumeria graminis f. sp. tritici 96224]|uniref:Putative secreted effector protein n=1 Tax=Blumeria graminis f. sp. tritici 96224 TaxID=1268274 RepID=A0A656KIK9_BLUGR|nr:putative secreted effector protein [Blumeria graminis f. sp. tritici 96224]
MFVKNYVPYALCAFALSAHAAPLTTRHEPVVPLATRHEPVVPLATRHEPVVPLNARHEPVVPLATRHELVDPNTQTMAEKRAADALTGLLGMFNTSKLFKSWFVLTRICRRSWWRR